MQSRSRRESTWRPRNPLTQPTVFSTLECVSCGTFEDVVPSEDPGGDALCRECRSPLRYLEFPDEYCDLGVGD